MGRDAFRHAGCPVWQCEAYDYHFDSTKNNGIPLDEYDAIIFYDSNWNQQSLPAVRSAHQRYIFWNAESPTRNLQWENLAGIFNLTMTYRWDSDIVLPYGWFYPKELGSMASINYAQGKTKLVAWFASNCRRVNGRFEFVQRLQDFVAVDVYGKCGTFNCSAEKTWRDESCRSMVFIISNVSIFGSLYRLFIGYNLKFGQAERDYKFYLALDNSLCLDYVTEKFFWMADFYVVPVVFDLHDNYKRLAPPKSYINALDFPSIKDLADYLVKLDNNDDMYNQYFEWKNHFGVVRNLIGPELYRGLCRLCSVLHEPQEPASIYINMTKWWYSDSRCMILDFVSKEKNPAHVWRARNFQPKDRLTYWLDNKRR